ncbi:MAG: PAS domain S-box protein [Candidatus Eremiobacterota bacterium]
MQRFDREKILNSENSSVEKDRKYLDPEQGLRRTPFFKCEDCFLTVIDASKDAIIAIDEHGLINIFNIAAEKMFGHKKEDVTGKSLDIIIPEDYRDIHREKVKSYLTTGKPDGAIGKTVTLTALRSDNTLFPIELSLSSGHHKSGIFVLAIIRDITERKHVEQELKEYRDHLEELVRSRTDELKKANEKLQKEVGERKQAQEDLCYRLLMEQLVTAISTHFINLTPSQIDREIYWALKALGEFVRVDRCFVDLYSDDLTGIARTYEWCTEGVQPRSDRLKEMSFESFSCSMEQKQLFDYIHIPGESEFSSDKKVKKEVWIACDMKSLFAIPLVMKKTLVGLFGFSSDRVEKIWKEEDIKLLKMVGEFFVNLFDRKKSDEELWKSRQMLQVVLDSIPARVFWKNSKSVYLGCNSLFASDRGLNSPEEITGKTDYELAGEKDKADLSRKSDRRVMKTDTPEYHMIESHIQSDGKQAWLDTNKIPLHDTIGNVIGIIGTYEDITEQKKSEQQLQEAREYAESIIHTMRDSLVVLNSHMKIVSANQSFYRNFNINPSEAEGQNFYEVNGGQWNIPELRNLLEYILPEEHVVEDFEINQDLQSQGRRTMLLNVRKIYRETMDTHFILLLIEDITDRKEMFEEKTRLINHLQQSLEHINQLKGLIPICSSCKKIRDDNGFWHQVEAYIEEHSHAEFSHSICPDCLANFYPEYYRQKCLDKKDRLNVY